MTLWSLQSSHPCMFSLTSNGISKMIILIMVFNMHACMLKICYASSFSVLNLDHGKLHRQVQQAKCATWSHQPSGIILRSIETHAGLSLLLFFLAMLSFRKPFFYINCCHAAKACGCYSLSISMIMNISRGKHAFNAGPRVLL
jgi:hypothetical protein